MPLIFLAWLPSTIHFIARLFTVYSELPLSLPEKNFVSQFCIKLESEIQTGLHKICSARNPEQQGQYIEDKIGQHLNNMSAESKNIALTSGLRGFINDIFAVLGWNKPFTFTNSTTINTTQDMKARLLGSRHSVSEPEPEEPKEGVQNKR